ncbi:leader peptidase (prepilin peptidase) / N-methyltransferase [Paenibacillus sp. yr247]|uniref:prepilin peptidase n=1 Tax=Paenibacillus sp. yr247 TaxID=1761880 RepID=UPI00088AECFE|nr:A24 family peptidase [Paenibacillus sp. yr247]SDN82927.1 leader peptidase (prepilin peptidase) / N-methyltransferase [Paenibacillus sp. yr247]
MESLTLLYAITAALFGLVFGSFFNVVGIRVVKKESIAYPPSRCVHCDHELKPLDLIPVLSYLGLRGACRYCRAKISPIYPIGEFVTSAAFAVTTWQIGPSFDLIVGLIFVSILMICSIADIMYRIIPDVVVFSGMIAALLLRIWIHPLPFWNYFAAFFIGGGLLYLIALASILVLKKEGMGGGDIKLFAFIGLIAGIKLTLFTLFAASLLGTIYGLVQMLVKSSREDQGIPFGPFIAAGAFFSYFWGEPLITWYLSLLHYN